MISRLNGKGENMGILYEKHFNVIIENNLKELGSSNEWITEDSRPGPLTGACYLFEVVTSFNIHSLG